MLMCLLALALMLWTVVQRRVVALAFCFLFVSFAWKLVAAAYIGFAGPVYAEEIGRALQSPTAAGAYGLAILLTLAAFALVLHTKFVPDALAKWEPERGNVSVLNLGDLVFAVLVVLVLAMYADLLYRGNIPIFSCLERFDYTRNHAGPLHSAYFKYGPLLALQLGTFTVYPRILGRPLDWRFLGIAALLFGYSLVTGERYSAFYKLLSFYAMPFAAILALRYCGRLPDITGVGRFSQVMARRSTWAAIAIFVIALIAGAIANSYINVRSAGGKCAAQSAGVAAPKGISKTAPTGKFDPTNISVKLKQRVLVQPIQMWFVSWNRVLYDADWEPERAAEFMFDRTTAWDGNKGMRYLMLRELGEKRAAELKRLGNQFAGGYPEVLFELLGPWMAWPMVFMIALITAGLVRHWLLALIRGHLITAFFAAYVLYAFMVLYIGGMTNFLVTHTFWAKVSLLALFSWFEPHLVARGRRLLPYQFSHRFLRLKERPQTP